MAISVGDVVNEDTLTPFLNERLKIYEERATALLLKYFGPAAEIPDKNSLRRFVIASYELASTRGIVSEKEQLHYLTIAFRWGIGFESDPQYRPYLRRAMWLVEDDRPMQVSDTLLLREEVASWETVIASDLNNTTNIRTRLFNLYRRGIAEPSYTQILSLLRDTFPSRFQTSSEQDWVDFCDNVYARIEKFSLNVVDVYCCIVLAVWFGHDFMNDTRYHWARGSLGPDGRSLEQRRIAFGEAVVSYWDRLTLTKNGEVTDVKS